MARCHHPTSIVRFGITVSILRVIVFVCSYSIGDVNPRALRGVWRLTSLDKEGLPFARSHQRAFFPLRSTSQDPKTIWKLRGFMPMKEFTTYPKKKLHSIYDIDLLTPIPKKQTEIFIKLKGDQTFEQCAGLQFSDGTDEDKSMEEELAMEVSKRERESFAWKGTWDFVDGKLVLAADRPEKDPSSVCDGGQRSDGREHGEDIEAGDMILVGRVAVQSEKSLTENPALEQRQMMTHQDASEESDQANRSSLHPKKGSIDIHLSVPKGKIKTGKFMYPKTHPSFFEQPIICPQSKGRYKLQQILGEPNAKLADDDGDAIELFRKTDFIGKRFYLSTFPLPNRRKKFEKWDVTKNSYVKEEYEPTEEEKKEEEGRPGKNMQVMAIELFANSTFSTVYGLGSSMVLRGKWSIIGDKHDQLWMMVHRFGFGRSVSGSTFSEGTSLTQNDEKGYWGKIIEVEDGVEGSIEGDPSQFHKKIKIKGTVMVGWGLEPCSVGRFKMIEIEDALEEEDTEEEEYDEISVDDMIKSVGSLDLLMGTDLSNSEDMSKSFDLPGAFE